MKPELGGIAGWMAVLVLLVAAPSQADFFRAWDLVEVTEDGPGILAEHGGIFDPVKKRLVVFGGYVLEAQDETFALDLGTDVEPNQWNRIPALVRPIARFNHVTVYDPARHRMLIFGGTDNGLQVINDAWAFDLTTDTWSPIAMANAPFLTRTAAAVDEAQDRVLLFGGFNGVGFLNATYSWDLGSDQIVEIAATNRPFPRYGSAAAVDPDRNRLLVFGGNQVLEYFAETWELDLASGVWSLLNPPTGNPGERAFMSSYVDRELKRWILFGGNLGQATLDDTWSFDFPRGDWTFVSVQTRPTRRNNTTLVFDSVKRLAYLSGGNLLSALLDDVWRFTDNSFDSGSGLLRFNGESGAVDVRFVNGGPIRLEIQGLEDDSPYVLFAVLSDVSRRVVLPGGIPFCFDPNPLSPGFCPSTFLLCDPAGFASAPSPLMSLLPARITDCSLAPALPGFAVLFNATRIDLSPNLGPKVLLQAVIRDRSRPGGFGSTPCVRVTVVP